MGEEPVSYCTVAFMASEQNHTENNTPAENTAESSVLQDRDWAREFDHADPSYNANAHTIWEDLRGRCPVAHTEAYGGTWLPVRHEDVHAIAYDTQHFSSVGVVVSNVPVDFSQCPVGGAPPITSDPPFHSDARRLLLPAFAPKPVQAREDDIREMCQRLLKKMRGRMVLEGVNTADAAREYAQHIPVYVIADMLGLPQGDADMFRGFVHDVLEGVNEAPEDRIEAIGKLASYLEESVIAHETDPQDDLTTYLMNAEMNGEKLTREHVVGTMILLLIAGIDTTWSAIGSALWHLGTHPEDRRRLVTGEAEWALAIEELLRAYAPVTMARVVREEIQIGDVVMQPGDWTLLPFPAANRDPEMFDRADEVLIDREQNRHAAFGLGIHRCIGSNLARLELTVAVQEFLREFPEYSVEGDVVWSIGQVRGPRELPFRVD
jgi:cytochrome P450